MINNTLSHTVNGQEYEIRPVSSIEGLAVAIFRNGKQIASYRMPEDTPSDFKHCNGQDPWDMLIDQAKSDLDNGIVR